MATYFWVGGAGTWDASSTANWALTSGGLPGIAAPNNTDTVIFDSASGTGTCTTAAGSACATATLNSATLGLTLGANHTMSGIFTLTSGSLDLGSFTLTCGRFLSNNSNVRTIAFGTGNITLTANSTSIWTTATATNFTVTGAPVLNATYSGAAGTRVVTMGNAGEANAITLNVTDGTDIVQLGTTSASYKNINFTGFSGSVTVGNAIFIFGNLTISTGMTVNAGTSSIQFRGTSGTQEITTNGKTLDIPISCNGVGGTFAFQDALTQGSTKGFFAINGTIQFKHGVTSTVGGFTTSGTTQKFLQSTLAGSQATLSQASGTVNASYLTIKDIDATGGATWNAFVDQGNVDAGNVDGWDFGISPVVGGAEYTYALRSFTQPRRF